MKKWIYWLWGYPRLLRPDLAYAQAQWWDGWREGRASASKPDNGPATAISLPEGSAK